MLAQVEPAICRRERALPLPYLRLLYHPERELRASSSVDIPAEKSWRHGAPLSTPRTAPEADRCAVIAGLLARRRMNWYEEAVVPMLHVLLGGGSASLS